MTTPWTRDLFKDEDDGEAEETGIAFVDFAAALQVWSCMQRRPTRVGEAATAFNVAPELVVEAVGYHYWMFLSRIDIDGKALPIEQWLIEHEGE